MRRKYILISVVILSLFLTLFPLLSKQWFFTHDFVHGARIAEYSRGLLEGQFPVIWSKNFGFGYGMPLFLFYAPLPYLLGSLWYLVGLGLVPAVKVLYLTLSIIGSLGVYLLTKKTFNSTSGLVAATVYTLIPYRALNLYVRGAVSESFGMAFSPFVLWGVLLTWQKKWYGMPVLAFSLFLVAISHNLSFMLILPIAVVWLMYLLVESLWLRKTDDFKTCLRRAYPVVFGIILGIGMSLFYLIPAAVYQHLTKLQQIVLSGYSDYRHHFLYVRQFFDDNWGYGGSNWGPNDGMSFFLGYAPLFCLGFFIGNLVTRLVKVVWFKKKMALHQVSRLLFFAVLTLACLLFTTPKVQFIWQSLSILQVLQFPWRFLGPVALLSAVIGGGIITLVRHSHQKFIVIIVILLSFAAAQFFKPQNYLENDHLLYYADPSRIASEMSGILPDYIPQQLPDQIPVASQAVFHSSTPLTDIQLISWTSDDLVIGFTQAQTSAVTLSVANFPGWRVILNDQVIGATSDKNGLITVNTPTGHNLVELKYDMTNVQKLSLLVSLVSWALLVILSYLNYRKNQAINLYV